MNYITYEKDIAQSKSFYETFKACIQQKQCYDNIKRIIFDTKAHPYQIAFGYMSSGTVSYTHLICDHPHIHVHLTSLCTLP